MPIAILQDPPALTVYKELSAMYLQNKYSKYYYNIIERAQSRTLSPEVYKEEHHIIPDCFFINRTRKGQKGWLIGNPESPDNKVLLTGHEHFVCHLLLTKMTEGRVRFKMITSVWRMCTMDKEGRRYKITGRTYAKVRQDYVNQIKGRVAWNRGRSVPEEQKARQSATRKSKNGTPGFNVRPACRPEKAKASSETQKGRKWIYYPSTNERKPVNSTDVNNYLSIGWKLGQGIRKKPKTNAHSAGMKWVIDPTTKETKLLPPVDFSLQIIQGWVPGRKLPNNK